MTFEETYAGLRVVDLSENIAGPLACMILADLGADVVKVERVGVGDSTRELSPRWDDESTVFLAMNRNKRSVAVDFRSAAGQAAVAQLAARADVVVESFRPGVAAKLGWDHERLRAANPRLVHCSVTAFGTGPLGGELAGYDGLIQAFTGIMAMTGEPDGAPCRAAPSLVDISTGLWAALAIQAALARRGPSGPGEHVEVALVDSGFFLLGHQIMGFLATGEAPGRLGSAAPSASPNQAFRAADAHVMIATSSDRLFARLCTALDLPDLPADARFASATARVQHRDALTALIERRLAGASAAHWCEVISAAGVPVSTVNDLADSLSLPVTRERAVVDGALPGRIDGLQQLRLPMDDGRRAPLRQPPALGEHTESALAEAGVDPAVIAEVLGGG